MLKERKISEEWVWRTIDKPEMENMGEDNNIHYFKSIFESENRILHVVVNPNILPKKVITVFFDRRAMR